MLKEDVAIALKDLVEHNAGVWPAHQFCQFALALLDGRTPQVFTFEFDQVESDQNRVFLVEAWRDQAALDVHAKLPRMAQNQQTYGPWLVSRKATRCTAD